MAVRTQAGKLPAAKAGATLRTGARSGQRGRGIGDVAVYVVLLVGAAVVFFPFLWMLLGSFKTLRESNLFPPTFLPRDWHPQNYPDAWLKPSSTLGRYLWNSAIIATAGTLGQLVVGTLAAVAFVVLMLQRMFIALPSP